MSKQKGLEPEEVNVWTGFGFLRQLIKSTRKNINKVNVLYAGETEAGTVGDASKQLHKIISGLETSNLWVIRPKYMKNSDGSWRTVIPSRKSGTNDWFAIDAATGFRAFIGNLLAGPTGEGYLSLNKSLVLKLRSGDFNAKVRSKIFGKLSTSPINTKTFKGIQQAVGLYLVYLMVKHAKDPHKMAGAAFINVCRWAIIDHIVHDLKDDGDLVAVKKIKQVLRQQIDVFEYAGVSKALKATIQHIRNDPKLSARFDTTKDRVVDRMEAFLIDILYKVTPDLQRVFALDGKHRIGLAVERKVLGHHVNRTLSKPVEGHKLIAVPEFDTRKKRTWLRDKQDLNHSLYEAMRRAAVMPEDTDKGVCGFRIGGSSTGQRSPPPSNSDGNGVTMFLTPMLALADAARRGESSTILWGGKFDKEGRSLHSGTVSGVPIQGYVHLDISKVLATQAYIVSQYIAKAALLHYIDDTETDPDKSRLVKMARISALFSNVSTQPIHKTPLRTVIAPELARDDLPESLRHYLSLVHEGCDVNLVHAAFWPTSMVVKYIELIEDPAQLEVLQFGNLLRRQLEACTTRKQRRWAMYATLDGGFSASLFSHAIVETARLNVTGYATQL